MISSVSVPVVYSRTSFVASSLAAGVSGERTTRMGGMGRSGSTSRTRIGARELVSGEQ